MNEEIRSNAYSLLNSADLVYNIKDYTGATILYFKALFIMLDIIILEKEGKTPKDHSERFRILQINFPDLYDILDEYYSIYRDTYSSKIDKETCDKIRENVKKIIKKYKI